MVEKPETYKVIWSLIKGNGPAIALHGGLITAENHDNKWEGIKQCV